MIDQIKMFALGLEDLSDRQIHIIETVYDQLYDLFGEGKVYAAKGQDVFYLHGKYFRVVNDEVQVGEVRK